jgi:preprotein translocase subunit SecD
VDGSELRDASALSLGDRDNLGATYNIMFSLTSAGAQKFGDWTGKNINNYLAVVLNDEVKSAAYIKTQILDQGQIDGRFTKQAAEDLALIMKSGYLPATFQLIDEKKFE